MDKNALASDDSNGYVNIVNGLNASKLYTFFKKKRIHKLCFIQILNLT